MCFAVTKGQCPAYLPDVLHVGMPETSYEGSALLTCLWAANRAGVRDLNAANKLIVYQEETALNTKHLPELAHKWQLPGSNQTGQAGSDGYQMVKVTALYWLGMQDKHWGRPKRVYLNGDLIMQMHHANT